MADFSIQDLTSPHQDTDKRAASFRRPQGPALGAKDAAVSHETPTIPCDLRRAAEFHPPEAIAARRDVISAFKRAMDDDAALLHEEAPALAHRARFASAMADEVAQNFAAAALTLTDMRRQEHAVPDLHWRAQRRIWRQLDEWDLVEESLACSAQTAPGALGELDALESATLSWLRGASPEKLAMVCAATAATDTPADPFITFWRTQLLADALLASGDMDAAIAAIAEVLQSRCVLPPEVDATFEMLVAIHENLEGDLRSASERLARLAHSARLPAEMLDAWSFLLAEQDMLDALIDTPRAPNESRASCVLRARLMIHRKDVAGAQALLCAMLKQGDTDAQSLIVHEHVLEVMLEQAKSAPEQGEELAERVPRSELEEELVQVLNLRLDTTPGDAECVSLLLRLGRLYEGMQADDAAAEVYREALELIPTDAAVLRALGRIYSRNTSWEQLAALYEHEIAALVDEPSVWRRHFQVARLYEEHLDDARSALAHYMRVLQVMPLFLPALKSSARLMEKSGQWMELADLFLARVSQTESSRQRLYMLDKVAEIAETHLGNDAVAMGAWREILLIAPEHPNAYAALGRLLARNGQWRELVALNEQEMGHIEDIEELADLCLRNAEVLGRRLGDAKGAEAAYRHALQILPDFLPALEGLGRLLAKAGRWDALVEMTSEELSRLDDPREQVRQLGQLAELAELQLGQIPDAITLHENALERVPGDINAYFALHRLYRASQKWEALVALIGTQLEHTHEPAQLANLHAELAALYEWKLVDLRRAFGHYRAALCVKPENAHWVGGLARLWSQIGEDPEKLAVWLTEVARSARLTGEIKSVFRKLICRLHERAAGVPEAALDLRRAGQPDDVENGLMLRLIDGVFDDREALLRRRVSRPLHDWEVAANMPRHGLGALEALELGRVFGSLDATTQQWFARELAPERVVKLDVMTTDQTLLLGLELARQMHLGQRACHDIAGPETSLERMRLRALEARRVGEHEEYLDWVRREIAGHQRADIIARRHLEVASLTQAQAARLSCLTQATHALFPEINDPDARGLETPVSDDLYDALYAEQAWALLRDCLQVHTQRESTSRIRKAYLWDMLSDLLERYVEDAEAAFDARHVCWELTGEADHLIALVRLSEQLARPNDALFYQEQFFEKLWSHRDVAPQRCVRSGLKLARMLRERSHEGDNLAAMGVLEDLLGRFEESSDHVDVRLELARVHASHGDPYAAAELFRRTLAPERVAHRVADWREFVRIWRDGIGDAAAAYNLQWTLVRFDPCSEQDLTTLVDLAEESGALDNCAHELERFGAELGGAGERALCWRAAMIFDEYLGWFEQASKLYEQLLVGCEQEPERVRLTRRLAMCLSHQPAHRKRALAQFRELVAIDPFDVATYRGMSSLFTCVHTPDRARVAVQVQRTLGDDIEVERVRAKTVPSRPLEEAGVLSVLLPKELDEEMLGALRAAMPLANKVWADDLPQRKALENDRRASRELMPIADLFYVVGDALALNRLKVWFGDSHPSPVQVLGESSPLIWLNTETLSAFDEPELRFMAGYTAALAWSEVGALMHLDGREVWHLLEGVYARQMGKGFRQSVDEASQRLAEQTSSPLHAVARRRVLQALEPVVERMADVHCEAWPRAIAQFAMRVGLVLCGDVEAAARCILKLEGWRGDLFDPGAQKMIRRHDHLRELIGFALSEDYLETRYKLGLAGRPSSLEL